ncbi:MAG: cyclic nucleotide-binding domain-containing protein [Chloroflexi bacterium]|nr:cyclic nucleotide-binding domain-containing protein [Chloroflexota bacterium]
MIPQPIDQVPLFQNLSDDERQPLIARLRRRTVASGELIFAEGYPSDALYVVHAGLVKLSSGSKTATLANLGAGSLLGEVDCLLERPYSATAHAAANTELLVLARADIEELISEHPGIGLKLGAGLGVHIPFLEQYLVQHRLRNIELLSALSEEDLRLIAQSLGFGTFARGDTLIEDGMDGEAAFIIEEGQVRLITESSDGTSFDDLNEGQIFGLTSLITGKPYTSTARAVTPVNVWVLARENYQYLINERPAIKLAFSRALAESLSTNDQADAVQRMRALDLFHDVPNDALTAIAARLVLRHFPAEEAIYTEGTPGDAMYIIEAGEVKLMETAFSDAQLLERIRAGSFFGEMALLTGRTRAECARAATDTTVWVLYKGDFDDVMVRFPEISVSLSRAITDRLASRENDFVIRHLRRIALFSNLTNAELNAIAKKVRGLRFRPGEIICFGGQPAHTLYMIERGEVKRIGVGPNGEPVTVDLLDAGDSFSEQAIVQNLGYEYTAQALEEVEVWTISKGDFVALMEQYPSLAMTVTRLIADRLSHAQGAPASHTRPPTTRPPGAMPPPRPPVGRIQRPPSGARPISRASIVPPIAPNAILPGATASASAPAQPVNRAPRPPKPPFHLPFQKSGALVPATSRAPAAPSATNRAPRPPKPGLHLPFQHVHAAQAKTQPVSSKLQPAAPKTYAPAQPRRGFFAEAGEWLNGLSFGAKMRALTLGALVMWLALIALPFTTISAVSSTVGGLQISNAQNGNSGTTNASAQNEPDPINRLKIAFAIPTDTPRPTPTPKPTSTPRPTPTRVVATRVPPTPVPAPVAAAPAAPAAPPLAPRYIDPRLGNGPQVLPHLEGVKVEEAQGVQRGQKFWRVISLKFENIDESGSDHTIYVKVLGEDGKRVDGKKAHLTSVGGLSEYPDEKPAADMCDCNYNYPMYGDGYGFNIEDQYPSDKAMGMIMPLKRHVNYRVTFQLVTMP